MELGPQFRPPPTERQEHSVYPFWAGMRHTLLRRGGFSANASGAGPTTGYMVSKFGSEERKPTRDIDPEDLADYARRHHAELSTPGAHHGGWVDKGIAYQDVSHRHTEWAPAYTGMVKENQKALYDVAGVQKDESKTQNPAYQHELVEEPERRMARSISRMSGQNVGRSEESSPGQDRAQAWFASAVPVSVARKRPRILHELLQDRRRGA